MKNAFKFSGWNFPKLCLGEKSIPLFRLFLAAFFRQWLAVFSTGLLPTTLGFAHRVVDSHWVVLLGKTNQDLDVLIR